MGYHCGFSVPGFRDLAVDGRHTRCRYTVSLKGQISFSLWVCFPRPKGHQDSQIFDVVPMISIGMVILFGCSDQCRARGFALRVRPGLRLPTWEVASCEPGKMKVSSSGYRQEW
eukprot:scaffold45512_cov124-Cyclotella_meneghiniana.AAC.1